MKIKRFLQSICLTVVLIGCSQFVFAEDSRMMDNLDGTVKDTFTNLIWVKDPNVVPEISGPRVWPEALKACDELVYANIGPNVWRLPHIEELKSLLNSKFRNPQINTGFFVAEGAHYWSKTPYYPGARAWTVNFKNGALGSFDKYNPDKPSLNLTRCVAKI